MTEEVDFDRMDDPLYASDHLLDYLEQTQPELPATRAKRIRDQARPGDHIDGHTVTQADIDYYRQHGRFEFDIEYSKLI